MKISITGTIGSGKSTVADYFREKGYYVFDVDRYNSELLKKGNKGYLKVKDIFPECFDKNELNKKKLASIIFNDFDKKKVLENILHPLIIEEMLAQSNLYNPFFAEVPLLFECNLDKYFDYNILVVSSDDLCINRLLNKGYTYDEALERLDKQMPVKEKMLRTGEILYNNTSLEDLNKQIENWINTHVR